MEHLAARFEFLRTTQNPDGGWGYFPGKQSWLEPTVYAALALARDPLAGTRVETGWGLIEKWQNADGGWRPAAGVTASTWCTALALTLGDVLGVQGAAIDRGVHWLVTTTGAESSTLNRVLRFCGVSAIEREVKYPGWPWRPGTSAWVEPTAHSLVALRKVGYRKPSRAVADRIAAGERMLLSVRCTDGGWNYGSPRALGIELPSYSETTALALIGLQDHAPPDAVNHGRGLLAGETSPLARAWLSVATRQQAIGGLTPSDVLISAIEALDPDLLRCGAGR